MDNIWSKHYPQGLQIKDISEYQSLNDYFSSKFTEHHDKVAFSNFGIPLTFGEIDTLSQQFAAYLQHELDIQKGDRVAVMLPNCLQYPIALYAITRMGAILVNINPSYTTRELKLQLNDCGAKAILAIENSMDTLQEVYQDCPQLEHIIVTKLGDLLGGFKQHFINFGVKYIRRAVPYWKIPGVIHFKDSLDQGAQLTFTPAKCDMDDVAALQYTGGTTGLPKGAMLTHKNLLSVISTSSGWLATQDRYKLGKEVILGVLPIYHIYALYVCTLNNIFDGNKTVLITDPRDIIGFVQTLSHEPVTIFVGVNTLFQGLMSYPFINKARLSEVKLTISGGSATLKEVSDRWQKFTGQPIKQGYGLTETCGVVTVSRLDELEFRGSIGLPLPGYEISIRDDNNNEVQLGQSGQLWIRSDQIMKGYWNHSAENAQAFDEQGFFATGDIVKMDKRGQMYIVDRSKDLILVSGFNVYPTEIEEVILAHPGVKEVGVCGVANNKTGEAVKAVIVKGDPNVEQQDIEAYCRKNLAAYKVPKIILFTDELPKTAVGKLLRNELQELKLAA